ncbi:MAG: phenylalanine--tRNA ligase subunit alpha [Bdellovibrio sp. CG10_big_fil_rev_8_21_14_0_10_47_8]|nr:MAG: phenylalanine--tRNA ligase subunit alpha [Bdellovibrio sp. CG10_big_fil_rev_8_21_14_0_10_47_8]
MSQAQNAQTKLEELRQSALAKMQGAASSKDLYEVKVEFLGKNGFLTEIMKEMASLPKEEKPLFGKLVNEVKQALEQSYQQAELKLKAHEIEEKMANEEMDLTLPAVGGGNQGSEHPVAKVTDEIVRIMSRLGYSLRQGPWIEKDFYNFEALNIPANHPARDMQDTFFIDPTHVLRTHTSPIQIHSMESERPPLRILGTGAVFRCDSDISHLPHFHQIEGMCVDRHVSMADLKGTVSFFVREFFGAGLKTRFRPSFFPFTEPSAEIDCTCPICKGKGCSLCKSSGWIEIGGCGLINPKVFGFTGVQYPEWQGFAFGFGIERMAIIKYGVEDIRLFVENNLKFNQQFE